MANIKRQTITSDKKDVEELKISSIAGGNVNRASLWKIVWQFTKMLNIELPMTQQFHSWVSTQEE